VSVDTERLTDAIETLMGAIGSAQESGLFDLMADFVSDPDSINDFIDALRLVDESLSMDMKDWTHEGAHPSVIINNQKVMTVEQYRDVLLNLKSLIEVGEPLIQEDSSVIGNKYTHCTWGMCTDNQAVYFDPHIHIFPKDFLDDGRVTPIDRPPGLPCPFDEQSRRQAGDFLEHYGCFYRCRIFNPLKGSDKITKEEALLRIANLLELTHD